MGINWKFVGLGILGFIALIALAFTLELGGLKWKMFFAPKYANVERKVFEQTKSFVHGKTQDLAKYYREYQQAGPEDQGSLKAVIRIQFAEFDANNLMVPELKRFLINVRGY